MSLNSLDEAFTNPISMEPVKEKLRDLPSYMPKENDFMYAFGRYLSERLNPELVPAGFNLACILAIEDLSRGGLYKTEEGEVRMPVPAKLVGYPPILYSLLRKRIPAIAEAVCPPEFARGVKEVVEKINKEVGL